MSALHTPGPWTVHQLLDAGQAALHELDATIRCVTDKSSRTEMQAVADALRTAIANATGIPS